jgi:hypothetical protein
MIGIRRFVARTICNSEEEKLPFLAAMGYRRNETMVDECWPHRFFATDRVSAQ